MDHFRRLPKVAAAHQPWSSGRNRFAVGPNVRPRFESMATKEQLEAIATRVLPRLEPCVSLSQQTLFLARVMCAGSSEETTLVEEHFGKESFREVLTAPPPKIFDRESWNYWHVLFGMAPKNMADDFFTIYPWFKDRSKEKGPITAWMLADLPNYKSRPVVSVHEMNKTDFEREQ